MADEQERLLQQILAQLQQSGGNTNTKAHKKAEQALSKLAGGATKAASAKNEEMDAGQRAMDMGVRASVRTAEFTKNLMNASNAITENREDFKSLDPAINMVGDGMIAASKLAGGLADALGDAMKGIPFVGGAVGGIVSGLGKMTAALGEAAGNIVKTMGPMFTAALQESATAYKSAGQVGALGAEGLSGLANQAIDAGLSFNQFAGVINKTAPELTFALGSSAKAAETLAGTSKAMTPFRRGLLALGVGVEQQNELTAAYIVQQKRLGRNETQNSAALAQGSQNYIKNLTELSKLTGQSVTEAQKEVDSQMRHVRQSAAMREVERKLGGQAGKDAVEAITGTVAVLKKRAPVIAAGLQDALGGNLGTEAAKNFQKATGAAGTEIINQLKSGQIDRDTALAKLQDAAGKRYQALGGDKFAAAAGGMATAMEPVIADLQSLTFGADFSKQIGEVEKQVNKTASTTDKTTNAMINAQESMIRSAQALDKIKLQVTLPLAAAGIETFTKMTEETTKKMAGYAKIFNEKGMQGVAEKIGDETGATKALDKVKDTVDKGPDAKTTAVSGLVGGGIGAAIGTFLLPGIGTVLGAKLGATAGLALGAWFSSGKAEKLADKDAKKKLKTTTATPKNNIQKRIAGPNNKMQNADLGDTTVKEIAKSTTDSEEADSKKLDAAQTTEAKLDLLITEQQKSNRISEQSLRALRN